MIRQLATASARYSQPVGRAEALQDVAGVEAHLGERQPQVEQVAALSPLIEGPKLRRVELGGFEGQHLGGT